MYLKGSKYRHNNYFLLKRTNFYNRSMNVQNCNTSSCVKLRGLVYLLFMLIRLYVYVYVNICNYVYKYSLHVAHKIY